MDGLVSYVQAWKLLTKMKLWNYLIIPGLISLIVGLSIFGFAFSFSDEIAAYLSSYWPFKFGVKIISVTSKIFSKVLSGFIGFLGFKNAILLINSPFMSQLSEKIEEQLSGRKSPQLTVYKFFSDIKRAIRVTIRSFTKEMLYSLIALIIGGIFHMKILAIFIVQSYFAGAGNLDFTLERHLTATESNEFVKKHRGLAIGNGMVYILILLIPGIGLIFAPSLSAIAATVESLERVDQYKNALDDII